MSKGKYRITITETDTGKKIIDDDTDRMIVFFDAGDEDTTTFIDLAGTYRDACLLLWALDEAKDRISQENPEIKMLYALKDMFVDKTEITDLTALKDLK